MNDAPSGYKIEQALSAWQSARQRLLTDDLDLAHDEAALAELLGEETGNVQDILARLLRAAVHAASMAEAAGVQIEAMTGRRDRYRRRAEAMRATSFAMMLAIETPKITLPDLTASLTAGRPTVGITDENTIPDEYIKVTRVPDKAALMADLKVGVIIPGAELRDGLSSLSIRTK